MIKSKLANKIISFLLSLAMLFSITSGIEFSVFANTSGDYQYKVLNDGAAEIIKYMGSETDFIIPSTIDGYSVTHLGAFAFDHCSSLTITIPNSVTSIGNYAFYHCSSLADVTIPNSVLTIGNDAFSECNSLVNLVIPDSVKKIGDCAFSDCCKLENIKLGRNIHDIGDRTFLRCGNLTNISIDDNNPYFSSEDGVLFDKDKSKLIQYPIGNVRTYYSIPEGVINIENSSFEECKNLTNIEMPNTIISIDNYAFYNCKNLSRITIHSSVKNIGDSAFENCNSLQYLYIDDIKSWFNIKFSNAYSNPGFYGSSLYIDNELVTDLIIPDGVTNIGSYSFFSFDFNSVMVPNSVINIDYTAFYRYNLGEINYFGCENEWNKINKSDINSAVTLNYIYNEYIKESHCKATPTSHGSHTLLTCCEYCNEPVREDIEVIHYEVPSDVDATCTQNGLAGGTKCSVCDEVLTKGEIIPKLGHSFTKYISNNDATCIADGTKTAKCDRCNEINTITDVGSELGHSFTKYVSNNDATCTKDGTKTAKCDRCHETSTITETGTALGHSFKKYISDNNYTCTKDGTKTAKCDRCNVTDTIVDKGSAKHKYVVTNTIKATCTSQGSVTYTCTACSDTYIEIIPELEHNYKETVVKPTYTEKGYTKYVCSRCNDIYIDDKVDRLTLDFDKKYTGKLDNEEYGEVTYKIELPESGVLRINAESHNEAVGFYFTRDTNYLYSDNVKTSTKYNENLGYYVLRDEDFEDSKDTCIAALSGTVYLSVVKQTEANTNAEYSFSISYESSQESFSELNLAKYDNIPAAKAISLGSTYNGFAISKNDSTISGLESDEVDFYSISIPKGLPVVMKFQSDCKMRVEMYTRDAYVYNPFAPTSTDNDLSFSQEFYLYEGTQYIKIIASSTGKYKFSVSLLAPENLKVLNRKSNSVQLSWENMFGADGYQIQQYTSSGWMNTKSTTKTNYIISSLLPGRKYQFRVRQYVNINGKAYYSSWKNINASTLIDTSAYKISLSKTSYTYNGKAQKPSVTVKDSKGNKIAASNYTVTYASGRKNVGKYSVKITFKGNYSGSKTLYFTINPKATTFSSVTAKSKGFTVKWKKQATQTSGYEIQYATDSKFTKNKKTVTVSKNSTTSKTISKLKAKKKYYVRIRTYKTVKVNGKSTKLYSSWSKAKSVKTK